MKNNFLKLKSIEESQCIMILQVYSMDYLIFLKSWIFTSDSPICYHTLVGEHIKERLPLRSS